MSTPTVSCDVLQELQAVLRTVRHPDRGGVLQAQHRSSLDAGGADATVREPPARGATHAVSPPSAPSIVSDIAADIQAKTIRLLARLLRLHVARGLTSGPTQEG